MDLYLLSLDDNSFISMVPLQKYVKTTMYINTQVHMYVSYIVMYHTYVHTYKYTVSRTTNK